MYRSELKGLFVLLSRTQAGPGRAVKQEQEENSRNHIQAFSLISVYTVDVALCIVTALRLRAIVNLAAGVRVAVEVGLARAHLERRKR